MSSKSRNERPEKRHPSGSRPSWLPVVRTIISFWRGNIDLHSWALVVYALIIVLMGKLFTVLGLVLVGAMAVLVLVYYLDKWLQKYE